MIVRSTIACRALAIAGCASAFAFSGDASNARARLRVTIDGDTPSATFDPSGPEPPIAFSAKDGALESRELPLPIDGHVTLCAERGADQRFRIAFGRAERGVIDLGSYSLEPGAPCTVVVKDETGRPAADAVIYLVHAESRFPPSDPNERGVRTLLDDDRLVGATDERGELTLSLPNSNRRLVIAPPNHALEFVEIPLEARRVEVIATKGVALDLEIRCASPRLLQDGRVRAFFDLGGVGFERECRVNERARVLLDRNRPVNVAVEARGMRSARAGVESIVDVITTLDLDPLDLRFARLTARGSATRAPLTLDSLRLGRARAHPSEYPRRVDFAPDWNSFRIGTEEPPLLAAPPGNVDVSASAPGHRETIVRGLRFEGTIDEPTPITIDLPGILPVSGRVTDAKDAPLEGAIVTARRASRDLADLPFAWRVRGTVGFVASVVTDAQGRFRFESSAYEDLVFEVEAAGFATRSFGPIARDATHALAFRIDHGFALAGRVADVRAEDVVLVFEPISQRLKIAALGEDGVFRIERLAPAEYVVLAAPDPRTFLVRGAATEGRRLEDALESKSPVRVSVTADRLDLAVPRVDPFSR